MEDAGFAALQAGDADKALTILESRSDIALMLTSVTMPGSTDGLGLAHTVCKRWPAIKTIGWQSFFSQALSCADDDFRNPLADWPVDRDRVRGLVFVQTHKSVRFCSDSPLRKALN